MSPLLGLYLISSLFFLFGLKFLPHQTSIKKGLYLLIIGIVFSLGISFIENSALLKGHFFISILSGILLGLIFPSIGQKNFIFLWVNFSTVFNIGLFLMIFKNITQQYLPIFYVLLAILVFCLALFLAPKRKILPYSKIPLAIQLSLLHFSIGLIFIFLSFIALNPALIVFSTIFTLTNLMYCIILKKNLNFSFKSYFFPSNKKIKKCAAKDLYYFLNRPQNILIIPGYGFALAQAQHVLKELFKILEAKGSNVHFVIHPLSGRMYGHMNVLLSEMNIPEEKILDLEKAHSLFSKADVALIIGANDIVNPSACKDPMSPLYGMDAMQLKKIPHLFIFDHAIDQGNYQIHNPLFYQNNSHVILGNAKDTLQELISQF
jgi:NAD(P) transhydrogenase subunit beta